MKFIYTIVLCLITQITFGQNNALSSAEPEIKKYLDELRSATNDSEKEAKNKIFKNALERALQSPEAIDYPFSTLTTVGFIDSPDGEMRIVNWNVEQDDLSHNYYCFVLHKDDRRGDINVTELKDVSFGMPMQPTEILSSNEWYGALYYKIIPIKKGSKTMYTVLGWDYYNSMSQLRVIDVIYFTGKTVKLGSPIFKVDKTTYKRMFYEHSKKASMALQYEADRGRIMMDHLSPESPSMAGFKSFYVPDMSYDAFELEGNKWVLHEDVIGTNKGSEEKQYVYVKNEKTGKVEKKLIKAKWINPEDPDAPGGSSEHVAVTPETADQKEKEEQKKNEPAIDKKDKRDPTTVSFYKDVEKNKKRKKKN